ncbi:MAG: extracellular solute-binding protein, partial [Roseivivax sp.]|nr:extracellular solute-binding protein [Roseivivax sp.]
MKNSMSRRQFGALMGGSVMAGAMGSMVSAAGESLRLIWWGNPERDKRTYAVVDLYKAAAGADIQPETYAWGDYWQKLATQAAGRNLPDVIQMDYRYIFEYARRGQLAALDEFVGNELELGDFDPNQFASGKVDDKLYGVSLGANSMTHVYNKAVLDKIGYQLPDSRTWTTDDYVRIGKELKGQLPEGMYFSENMGIQEPRLQTWVRSRGKDLYTSDGKIAF